jgi:hypothetical protein
MNIRYFYGKGQNWQFLITSLPPLIVRKNFILELPTSLKILLCEVLSIATVFIDNRSKSHYSLFIGKGAEH